jgi:hypothetical protein
MIAYAIAFVIVGYLLERLGLRGQIASIHTLLSTSYYVVFALVGAVIGLIKSK